MKSSKPWDDLNTSPLPNAKEVCEAAFSTYSKACNNASLKWKSDIDTSIIALREIFKFGAERGSDIVAIRFDDILGITFLFDSGNVPIFKCDSLFVDSFTPAITSWEKDVETHEEIILTLEEQIKYNKKKGLDEHNNEVLQSKIEDEKLKIENNNVVIGNYKWYIDVLKNKFDFPKDVVESFRSVFCDDIGIQLLMYELLKLDYMVGFLPEIPSRSKISDNWPLVISLWNTSSPLHVHSNVNTIVPLPSYMKLESLLKPKHYYDLAFNQRSPYVIVGSNRAIDNNEKIINYADIQWIDKHTGKCIKEKKV